MVRRTVELKDLEANQEYNVQVRAIGDNETFTASNWSTRLNFTSDQDVVAPNPPTTGSGNTDPLVVVDGDSFVADWIAPVANTDASVLEDLKDYEVTVTDLDNPGDTAVYYTTNTRFEFTTAMNRAAFGTVASGVTDVPAMLADNIQIEVKARDYGHNLSAAKTGSAQNTAPGGFTLVDNLSETPLVASLSWDIPSGDDLLVYRVRRGITTGVYTDNFVVTDTTFTDSGTPRGTWYYLVEAYDKFGNKTDSNEVTVTVVGFWEADFAIPDLPTITNVASTFDNITQKSEITFDVTGPTTADSGTINPYDYHSYYVVRWGLSASGPWQYKNLNEPDNTATHDVIIENLAPDTIYHFGVKSVSEAGQSGGYQTGSTTTAIDTSAPTAPANLSATGSLKNIAVSWDANTEPDLAYYELNASQTPGFTPGPTNKVYQGNGTGFAHAVGDTETWYYRVRAVDDSGNTGLYATEVSATSTTPGSGDTTPPSDVTLNSVTATTYTHGTSERAYAIAAWTAATDDTAVTGYIVSYSVDGQITWTEIQAGPDETSYRIVDLEPGVTVAVRIKAFDAAGNFSTNWSTILTDTPANTDGDIQEGVTIVTGGSIQSENYGTGSGFFLNDTSAILGGQAGLNVSTVTDQLWFGNSLFANATFRVDSDGSARIGGAGAFYADSGGNIWSGNAVMASAPWEITAGGSARFDDVTITATNAGVDQAVLNVDGNFLVYGNLSLETYTVQMAGNMAITGSLDVNNGSINLKGGDLRVTSGDIESADTWVYGAGVGFRLINVNDVSKPGVLQAQGAEIDSLVVAGTSDFGGTTSVTGAIQSSNYNGGTNTGWKIDNLGNAEFGTVDISAAGLLTVGANFTVTNTGALTATGADITGAIAATSGTLQNMTVTGVIKSADSPNSRYELDQNGLTFYDDNNSPQFSLDATVGDVSINLNQGGDLSGDAAETSYNFAGGSTAGWTARGDTTNATFALDGSNNLTLTTTTTAVSEVAMFSYDAINNAGNIFLETTIDNEYIAQTKNNGGTRWGLGAHMTFTGTTVDNGIAFYATTRETGSTTTSYTLTARVWNNGSPTTIFDNKYISNAVDFDKMSMVVRGKNAEFFLNDALIWAGEVDYIYEATNYNGYVVEDDATAITSQVVIETVNGDSLVYRNLPDAQMNIGSDGSILIGSDGTYASNNALSISPNGLITQASPSGSKAVYGPGGITFGSFDGGFYGSDRMTMDFWTWSVEDNATYKYYTLSHAGDNVIQFNTDPNAIDGITIYPPERRGVEVLKVSNRINQNGVGFLGGDWTTDLQPGIYFHTTGDTKSGFYFNDTTNELGIQLQVVNGTEDVTMWIDQSTLASGNAFSFYPSAGGGANTAGDSVFSFRDEAGTAMLQTVKGSGIEVPEGSETYPAISIGSTNHGIYYTSDYGQGTPALVFMEGNENVWAMEKATGESRLYGHEFNDYLSFDSNEIWSFYNGNSLTFSTSATETQIVSPAITLSGAAASLDFTNGAGPQGLTFASGEAALYYRTSPNTLGFEDSAGNPAWETDIDTDVTTFFGNVTITSANRLIATDDGGHVYRSTTQSISNNTWTTLTTSTTNKITGNASRSTSGVRIRGDLNPGWYLATTCVRFLSVGTNTRVILRFINVAGFGDDGRIEILAPTSSPYLTTSHMFHASTDVVVGVQAYQSSGAAQTAQLISLSCVKVSPQVS